MILQNFVPHPRYYGAEPAQIADRAQRGEAPAGQELPLPDWADPITLDDMRVLVRECRRLMPDVGVQIPPNLSDWWLPLVEEGATDLGGLSANGDHISPEHPFPSPHRMRKQLKARGYALTERLCVYPQYMDPDWMEQGVLDVIKARYWSFIPRRGSGRTRRAARCDASSCPAAIAKGRDGAWLSPEELTALFAETRPEAIEDMRQAADELRARAGRGDRHVRGQPQHQRLQHLHRGLRVLRLRAGPALTRRLRARRARSSCGACGRRWRSAPPRSACSRASTPTGSSRTTRAGCELAKEMAPELHLHAYSPMEIDHMCRRAAAGRGLRAPARRRARLDAGHRRRGAARRSARAHLARTSCRSGRWVEIIEASHAAGLRSTVTVMFGHIEEPWELAEHMRVVRELQERTGGFTEFVPLSFIPYHTLLGRTHGIEEISREENLKHTAVFRLALGRSVRNLQASWVKMGLDAATEALRWGVNDLGGTLMEESISRMAGSQHGVRLEPGDLIAAAHRAGRPAAERDTLYGIRRRHELPVAA